MIQQFSPITLGQRLQSINAAGFVLTETTHQPNHRLCRHHHELTNIAFVLNGSFTEVFDRRSVACGHQSLLIKPPGEAHANRYGKAGMHCLLIEVQRQQLEALGSWSKALSHVRHVRSGPSSMLGMRLFKEFRMMDGAAPLAIEGLMLELVANLSRQLSGPLETKRPRWLDQARQYLEAYFRDSLSLSRVAAEVQVHPVHLARVFRKYYGCTRGEYLQRQ